MKNNHDNPNLEDDEWECMSCIIMQRAMIFPFGYEDNYTLYNLNSLDSIHIVDTVPHFDIASEALSTNSLNSCDIDEHMIHKINSKYYTCQEFFNVNNDLNSFKIHHTNANGLSCHIDTLKEFLVQSKVLFDTICISETSLKDGETMPQNDLLTDYSKPFTTNTLSSKGGVGIFVKQNLTEKSREREDLKICTEEANM